MILWNMRWYKCTCYTPRGSSTIDYVIASSSLIFKDINNHAKAMWNQDLCEQYTLSFDIEHIKTLQDQLNNMHYDMTITSENTTEQLYMEIQYFFIQPEKVTNMYKEIKEGYNRKNKVDRRHGSHVWINKNCKMIHRKCISANYHRIVPISPQEIILCF